MKKLISFFTAIAIICSISLSAQATKTWAGGTSTAWATAANWSPSGVPAATDNVVFNGTGTYQPILDANRTVANITVSGNTVNLNAKVLTVTGTTSFTAGTVNSGTLLLTNTTTTFAGTTFGSKVKVTASNIYFNGSTFNGSVRAIKTGTTANSSNGGNTFNDSLDIRDQSTGAITMCTLYNDNYNGHLLISNTSTAVITIGGLGTGTLASTKKITIGVGGFTGGSLLFSKFTQSGTTSQSLTTTGGYISFGTNCTWNGPVTFSGPDFRLNGSTFNKKFKGTLTSTLVPVSTGGNTFNDTLDLYMSGGIAYLAYSAIDNYNGDVFLSSTGGSSGFGIGLGTTGGGVLATGKKIKVGSGGFSAGAIALSRFTQNGSTAQSITMTGSATMVFGTGTTFNGTVTLNVPDITITGTTFNSDFTLTKTSTSSNTSDGGNTFNGTTSFTTSSTGYLYLANVTADTYNGNVSFIQNSTGLIFPAVNGTNQFKGNINVTTTSAAITFGNSAGIVQFAGNIGQSVNRTGSNAVNITRILVNKTGNGVTLNTPINVSTSLTLTAGIISSTTTNFITLGSSATVSGTSNNSYINGAISKTGDKAFTFPVGKGGFYRPISIAAPTNAATVFKAEYFNVGQTLGSTADTSLANMSTCEYWTLTRSGSSDNVNVTLGWNSNSCNGARATNMRVASRSGSSWINLGNGARTGNNVSGTVTTGTTPTVFTAFTLANKTCSYAATITPSGSTTACSGVLSLTAKPSKYYLWSTNATAQVVTPTSTGTYTVTIRDTSGCKGSASQAVTIYPLPVVNAGKDTFLITADTIQLSATVTGGTTPYSYLWSPSGFVSNTTILQPLAFPDTVKNFVLKVTDSNGCIQRDTVKVRKLLISGCGLTTPPCELVFNGDFESLLDGDSFTDMENALNTVWLAHPDYCKSAFSPPFHESFVCNWGGDLCTTQLLESGGNQFARFEAHDGVPNTLAPQVAYLGGALSAPLLLGRSYNLSFRVRRGSESSVTMDALQVKAGAITIATLTSISSTTFSTFTSTFTYTNGNPAQDIAFIASTTSDYPNSAFIYIDDVSITEITLTPTLTNVPNPGCTGFPIAFNCTNLPDGLTYDWAVNGTVLATNTNHIWNHAFTTPGTYSVKVTVTNENGCAFGNTTVSQTINQSPIMPLLGQSSPLSFCNLTNFTLSITNYNTTGQTYQWYNGTSPISGQTGPSYVGTAAGSYRVVVTNTANGCSVPSSTIVVNQNSLPSVSLTLGTSSVCLEGSNVTLSGGSPAGGIYTGNGVVNGVFSPTAAGVGTHSITYTYTDGNGCTNSASANMIVRKATTPVILGSTLLCVGANNYTGGNLSSNCTYDWSGPSGVTFTNDPNSPGVVTIGQTIPTTINWNGAPGGVITLTCTNQYGCVSTTTFTVNPCCTGTVDISNRSASWVLANMPGNVTGTQFTTNYNNNPGSNTVSINGTFLIDVANFQFYNAQVVLAQNAKIVIDPTSTANTLTLTDSWLHACENKMWDGIYVSHPKDLVVGNNSKIEDAKNAIVSETGGVYDFNNMIFNKNYIGIVVKNLPANPHSGDVDNSSFTSTSTMLAAVPPFPSYSPFKTKYGISVDNIAKLTIDGNNTFDGINNGIYVKNSNVEIYDNAFNNIIQVTPATTGLLFGNVDGGNGIIGEGSQSVLAMIKVGTSNTNYNTFSSVDRHGIIIKDAMGLEARYNTFTNVGNTNGNPYAVIPTYGWAIRANYNNNSAKLYLTNNTVSTPIAHGFLIQDPGVFEKAEINTNTLTFTPSTDSKSSGIQIYQTSSTPSVPIYGYIKILNNTINDSRYGVDVKNVWGVLVQNNTINVRRAGTTSSAKSIGIRNASGQYGRIYNNHLFRSTTTGSPAKNDNMEGIAGKLSAYSVYQCNDVTNLGKGLYFGSNNSPSNVYANSLTSVNYGLYLDGNGVIAPQGSLTQPSDNNWSTVTTSTFSNYSFGGLSKLFVRNSSGYIPSTNSDAPGLTASDPFTINNSASGTNILVTCPSETSTGIGGIEFHERRMLVDSVNYDTFLGTQARWLDDRALYQRIVTDTTGILLSDTLATNFKNTMSNSFIGLDYLARTNTHTSPFVIDTAVFSDYLNGIIDTLDFAKPAFAIDATKLESASNIYKTITTSNVLESTSKATNKIITNVLLRYAKGWGYSFTNAEVDSLSAQAQKCPYVYGPDVYSARAALMGVNDSLLAVYTSYESPCESGDDTYSGGSRLANPEIDELPPTLSATLYPNPAQNLLFIAFDRAIGQEPLTLRIFDLAGKAILVKQLAGMINEVDIAHVTNGLYIYDIIQNNTAIKHGKFIIAK